jgi:cytoplasmic iron level regulating protein YaaA (DUF328/UPF0246 family)
MLILLPPSEGKAEPASGQAVDLATLSLPGLTRPRERVLTALAALCGGETKRRQDNALAVLGLSPGQRDEMRRNASVREASTLPAGKLYTGVLYDALELSAMDGSAHAAAEESLLIFSGLWGAVRISDRLPAYRCAIGVSLPRLGPLAAVWRKALPRPLGDLAGDGLVVDLRSSAYGAMWAPGPAVAARTATVRVLHERTVDGVLRRSVVSHFNKATKGRLVRELLLAGARPESPAALVAALRDLKYRVEEHPGGGGRPWQLDIVVAEL